MRDKIRQKRLENGGFTLIELLLVIVILGILAAVVVISVRGITDRGETAACSATQTAVLTANEAYYAQNGSFPANVAAMSGTYLNPGAGVDITGDVVTGKGWNFTFTPATSVFSAESVECTA